MIFLVFGSTIRSAASTIAFFIFIFSCIYLYRVRGKVVAKLTKQEKVWLYSVVFLNIVVLLSSYNNFRVDFSSIDALTRFLFAIPLYFVIKRVGLDIRVFMIGGCVGAILMGIYAYYQVFILKYPMATGMTDHNYFGQLSFLLSFISLCGFLYFNDRKTIKWIFLLSSFVGLFAILASNSRGVWIAIPAVIVLVFVNGLERVSFAKKVISLILLVVIIYSSYFNNLLNFKNRVNVIANETVDFFQDGAVSGSAGLRLEMWRASLIMIKESNGLGLGDQGYTQSIRKMVAEKKVHPSMQNFDVEPHNYYLKTFVSQGFLGIVLLFFMLLTPGKKFYQNLKSRDKQIKITSILGAGIIIGYLDFMLTNTTLDVQLMSVFLAFLVFSLYANLYFER